MVTAKLHPAVVQEIERLECGHAAVESRRVRRIEYEIGRPLMRHGQAICRPLRQRSAHLLIERHPTRAIVSLEERVHVRPPERGLSRNTGAIELGPGDETQGRTRVDGGAGGRGECDVMEDV